MDYYDKLVRSCGDVASNVATNVQSLSFDAAASVSHAIDKFGTMFAAPPSPPPEPWFRKNKLFLVCGIGVAGAAAFLLFISRPKRRVCAARTADGGRQDVVLVVGSPSEPLVRVIVQELNLRSFIVYVATVNDADEQHVMQLHCADIRPLPCNSMDPASVATACQSMSSTLSSKVTTMKGGEPYYLNLAGVLLIPDLAYPQGPFETISQVELETSIASKIVGPLFSLKCGLVDLIRQHNSRMILLNPSIIANLSPPYHLMESISTAALDQLALTMYRELRPQSIPFSQIKLGSFDVGGDFSGHHRQVVNSMRSNVLAWPEKVRHLYAGSYLESSYLQANRTKGSSLDELHLALATMLTVTKPPRVIHVGRYSYTYEWLRNHVPEALMTWALS